MHLITFGIVFKLSPFFTHQRASTKSIDIPSLDLLRSSYDKGSTNLGKGSIVCRVSKGYGEIFSGCEQKPKRFPAEMVLKRDYKPSEGGLELFNFTRTTYCLNR